MALGLQVRCPKSSLCKSLKGPRRIGLQVTYLPSCLLSIFSVLMTPPPCCDPEQTNPFLLQDLDFSLCK